MGFYIEAVIEPTRILSKISATKRHNSNIVRMQSQSVLTLMASDILQSQAFEDGSRERGRKTDFSFSLALSETAGHADYDSDKDYSSDDSDNDENYSTEMSLLVKTGIGHTPSVLSSVTEATDAVGVALAQPLMSLMLENQEKLAAGAGDGTTTGQSTAATGVGGAEDVVEGGGVSKHSLAVGAGSGVKLKDIDFNLLTSESSPSNSTGTAAGFSQTHLTTVTTPDSPLRKGFSHSFSSVFSEDSHNDHRDSNVHASFASTSTTIPALEELSASPLPADKHMQHHLEDPLSIKWAEHKDEEEEEEEELEEAEEENASTSSIDPQTLAVNSYLSDVAADCVSWLMRKLGPLLATQYIAKPLVDNLHRCFVGIVNSKGKETSTIKCLSSYAEYYGENVILRFYIPYAENLVSP